MSALQWTTLGLFGLAVLIGVWRAWRVQGARRWIGIIGQPIVAILLWLVLYPPLIDTPRVEAVVLSPGVSARQLAQLDLTRPIVALPGVVATSGSIESAPDLATALRRNPAIGDVRVLGDGLPERDRDSLGQRGLAFEPGADLRGLLDVRSPAVVRAGSLWTIEGMVAGVEGAQIRLLDRSGAVASVAAIDESGGFRLRVTARTPGEAVYRLQLLDAGASVVDALPVGVVIRAGDSINTVILAGAADPEIKYLRRWIVDSGSKVASRISLSRGIEQRQNDTSLNAESLQETDLLLVDDRAWAGLTAPNKAMIRAAVEQGMGLLLRVGGPLSATVRAEWAELGFAVDKADLARSVRIAGSDQEIDLTRLPVTLSADRSIPMLTATDGSVLARWRAVGRGRIAVWLPFDTWRLVTANDKPHYGTLWSDTFSTLARARGAARPALPRMPRVDQRVSVCGIGADAVVESASAQRQRLLVDRQADNCAAWWPTEAGWQHLVDAERREPIFVLAATDATTLIRHETRVATSGRVRPASSPTTWAAPMPRWPLFLAWLLVSAGLWWGARRRPVVR